MNTVETQYITNKYYAKDISKKRRIYRMALEGYGLAETAARLAADGVVNPTYYNPEENRAIFLNVHEAIIDRQTWEKVQALQKGTRRKKPTVTQEPSVFSGLLKCPECAATSISTSTRTTTTSSFSVVKITTPAIASAARRTISGWTS